MKILYITNGSPLSIGGAEKRTLMHALNMKKYGHDVVIIGGKTKSSYKDELVYKGVKIYHVKVFPDFFPDTGNIHLYFTHLLFPLFSTYRVWKVIRDFKPDIIDDSITTASFPYPSIAPFVKGDAHCYGVRHEHYHKFWPKGYGFLFSLFIYYTSHSTLYMPYSSYLVCSESTRKDLLAAGVDKNQIACVQSGFNERLFFPKGKEKKREIIMIGRLVKQKGQDILIRAFAKVLDDFPDFDLRLVGEGYTTQELKDLAESLGISDRVIFEGYLPLEKMVDALRSSTLCVYPSLYEGFGVVIVEAMACQKAIICSDITVFKELIHDGKNGLLFKTGDPLDLAKKIKWMLSHPKERLVMKKQAFTDSKKFRWDALSRSLESVYLKHVQK